ncbi:MAG: radical SAM protein [Spirochaetales bacterium]|nr:radical SAM protein [Spirochaetales bacterium]
MPEIASSLECIGPRVAAAPLGLPVRVTAHLRSLMSPSDPRDPICRQFTPSADESRTAPGESADPLEESEVEKAPRLLHRYPDRALLLVTDRCAAYCRYCFRRESTGRRRGGISDPELRAAAVYVGSRPEVRELILSGGDPLTLPGWRLAAIARTFRDACAAQNSGGSGPRAGAPGHRGSQARELAVRIHTRVPVVAPQRVTGRLVEHLEGVGALRVVIQVNHPRELCPPCREAVAAFQSAGIPVLSQGVLLRGVNDDPEILSELWSRLAEAGVRPHHLFQLDLARGTGHFRVDLTRALGIYGEAVGRAGARGGAAVPDFALDLPGGGGKVLLEDCRILRADPGFYRVEAPDGRWALYPAGEGTGA